MRCREVRCGAVRCGAVLCGAVRCGAVRCGAVRCGAVRCGAVRCGAVRCGAVRCGAVRCGAVRCGAVRCGAVRCGGIVCVRWPEGSSKKSWWWHGFPDSPPDAGVTDIALNVTTCSVEVNWYIHRKCINVFPPSNDMLIIHKRMHLLSTYYKKYIYNFVHNSAHFT